MKEKIELDIINILHEKGFTDEADLETLLEDELGLDSLDKVELVMEIEKRFNIRIDDSEADKLLTLGDVVNLVDDKIEQRRPA